MPEQDFTDLFIRNALAEDLGDGDHSSLSCIPASAHGSVELLVKDEGLLAGMRVAGLIYAHTDPSISMEPLLSDGDRIRSGQIAYRAVGSVHSLLKAERLVLNVMQRMSGIATRTAAYVERVRGLKAKILDTRKTTPGMRMLDKEAVRIGGGMNHRMGLYDMIMLKDNHIDFAGGIAQAIQRANDYLHAGQRSLAIEIEARSLDDVKEILRVGKVQRIMLDNFSIEDTRRAVEMIAGRYETESSGGIRLDNLRDYAECGVDFISVGAITHQIRSLDLSLKAVP